MGSTPVLIRIAVEHDSCISVRRPSFLQLLNLLPWHNLFHDPVDFPISELSTFDEIIQGVRRCLAFIMIYNSLTTLNCHRPTDILLGTLKLHYFLESLGFLSWIGSMATCTCLLHIWLCELVLIHVWPRALVYFLSGVPFYFFRRNTLVLFIH